MKTLPTDLQLEQAILGASIQEKDAFVKIADIVNEKTFYYIENKAIYSALSELYSNGEPISSITVVERLKKLNLIDKAKGTSYVLNLVMKVVQPENIIYHARLLKQYEIKRCLIKLCEEIKTEAFKDSSDSFDLLSKIDEELLNLSSTTGNTVVKAGVVADMLYKELLEPDINDIGKCIDTGMPMLNSYLGGGFPLNKYVIIGGRPSMGKTALMLQMALNMARLGTPVMIFSRETDKENLIKRLICNIAEIEMHRLKPVSLKQFQKGINTILNQHEAEKVMNALATIKTLPMYINDTTGMSISKTVAITKKMIFQYEIKVVFGDYIQLIDGQGISSNRNDEISAISRQLKAMSQNLPITVIELAQLNRAKESEASKIPELSNLRGSGQLEQDAQIVIFPYRPAYYGMEYDEEGNNIENLMQLIIAKNKDGSRETLDYKFVGKYFQIKEY